MSKHSRTEVKVRQAMIPELVIVLLTEDEWKRLVTAVLLQKSDECHKVCSEEYGLAGTIQQMVKAQN